MLYLSNLEHWFGVIPTRHLVQQFIYKFLGDASTALHKFLETVASHTHRKQTISPIHISQLQGVSRCLLFMFTGDELPEGALYSCLIPVGRVQHVHLLGQQVGVDGVVLEGLRVVRTAEERHWEAQ